MQQSASIDRPGFEGWASLKNTPISLQALLWVIAIVAIVIDQATKWWIEANLEINRDIRFPIEAIDHIFSIVHVINKGAAFGTLQGFGWLFSAIAFVVAGGILFYNAVILERAYLFRIALGLILGGALGNVIDRIRLTWVTDFIFFNFLPLVEDYPALQFSILRFPVFNFADVFIVSGVFTLIFLMWQDNLPEDPWTEYEDLLLEDIGDEKDPSELEIPAYAAAYSGPIMSAPISDSAGALNGRVDIDRRNVDASSEPPLFGNEQVRRVAPNQNATFGLRVALLVAFSIFFGMVILWVWATRLIRRRR